MSVKLLNCNYYSDHELVENQTLVMNEGVITAISTSVAINEVNHLVVPGFIDLQIYGAGNRLFSANPTVQTLTYIEDQLLKKGTTAFYICIATNTPEVFKLCIEAVKAHRSIARNCLGIHLEGPFLNKLKRGAHIEEFIRKALLDEVKELLAFGEGVIKMITIAPELQDDAVIDYLLDQGIVVSLGHSNATYEEATAAFNKGIQTTTHLFNAMSVIQHRAPGVPTAVFNHPTAMASIIVDGMHVDFNVVKFAKKLVKERLFLITDAVAPCTIGAYTHQLVGDKFVMPDGTLSGSSLTMLEAVKNCIYHCDIIPSEAFKMASTYPAQLAQLPAGYLKVGMDANLVVLDEDLNLVKVIFKGNEI